MLNCLKSPANTLSICLLGLGQVEQVKDLSLNIRSQAPDSVNNGRDVRMKVYQCLMYKDKTKVVNMGDDSLCHYCQKL